MSFHKKKLKRIGHKPNASANITPTLSQSTSQVRLKDTQDLTSFVLRDSPYAQAISKLRSQSLMKNKKKENFTNGTPIIGNSPYPSTHSSTISPFLTKNSKKIIIKNAASEMSKSSHKIHYKIKTHANLKDIIEDTEKPLKTHCIEKENLHIIGKKLGEIGKMHQDNIFTFEIFEKYEKVFADVIKLDNGLGKVLIQIKHGYDQWVRLKTGYVAENTQLKLDLANMKEIAKELNEENLKIFRKIRHLSSENEKIGKEVGLKDMQYRSLQELLIRISNVSKEKFPPDEETWKLIIAEHKSYMDLCKGLRKDLKSVKANEKILIKVLDYLKTKGFPVEEAYLKVTKKNAESDKKPRVIESEDDENIINSPAKKVKKPLSIPDLRLLVLEKSLSISSSELVSSSDTFDQY